ncbi:type II toxin-antitoxin system HicB family antitoxin [Sphingomonas hengshuiensis]|uniref:CopG family transcriptional regulator n=1 Tax=Sphingomonas hengshuiensis TaxID=1609977 RepID=A0A7U4LFW6_9SPHN|nr:type II toxin-antitoxin system HicB family antitoxin [Sphingomonas hengshuiensis]AJP72942.1 CopG family transcriptional regulator [Sphingomonas hengshuiensis]
MKTYFAIVHKDPDSAYGVTFPDLPGCFSAADRLADVVPNACEAMDLWFDADAVIEPREAEEIAAEYAEDLAKGAFLIAVPRVARTGAPVRINISLDRGILNAIDAAASARKLTRSAFIAEATKNEIEMAH